MKTPPTMTPAAIRRLRASLGLTQRQLGVVLGCSESRVCHLEAGRYAPSGPLLRLLQSAAAGVPPQKLPASEGETISHKIPK